MWSHIPDKELESKIYKGFSNLKKTKMMQFLKRAKDLSRHFNKEDTWMTNKNRMVLNIISLRQIQIKNAVWHHCCSQFYYYYTHTRTPWNKQANKSPLKYHMRTQNFYNSCTLLLGIQNDTVTLKKQAVFKYS